MSGFFSIRFTIIGLKNIVPYTGCSLHRGSLYRGSFPCYYWAEEYRSLLPGSSLHRGSLYRGSFPNILLLLGRRLSFVIPGSWHKGS